MTENAEPDPATPQGPTRNHSEHAREGFTPSVSAGTGNPAARGSRYQNCTGTPQTSTTRDFEEATPKIGGILALRSENVTKKVNYDIFCEKLYIYVMNELKDGNVIVQVVKNPETNIIDGFEKNNKPKELSVAASTSTVDKEIHKEEIEEYVKDLKQIKANLKKLYGLICGNCTKDVYTVLKADTDFEGKLKVFDYKWLLNKVKTIVSGLDTKVNLHVSLPDVIFTFILLK